MSRFKVGDLVRHNYSTQYEGEIHDVRNDPSGYNYFVIKKTLRLATHTKLPQSGKEIENE